MLVAGSTRCCRRRSRRNQSRAQCAVQHNDSAHGKAKGSVEMHTQHQLGEGDQCSSAIVTRAQPCVPSIVWDCSTGKCLLLRNVCIVPIWLRNVPIWLRNVAEKCLHRPNMALIPILQLARLVCNHAPGLTCARPAQSFITRRCVARCHVYAHVAPGTPPSSPSHGMVMLHPECVPASTHVASETVQLVSQWQPPRVKVLLAVVCNGPVTASLQSITSLPTAQLAFASQKPSSS